MQKVVQYLLVVLVVFSFSCNDAIVSTENRTLGTIVFESEYVNHAWGYYCNGHYICENGIVYSYDLAKALVQWKGNSDGWYTEEELISKYHHFDTVRSMIPKDTIQWCYSLALLVNPSMRSDTLSKGADMGTTSYSIYLYRSEKQKYQKITLRQDGDWQWYNVSESAIELSNWFKRIQN